MNGFFKTVFSMALSALAMSALAHNPVVFSYTIINHTGQPLWLVQPPKWVSCGIELSQIRLSESLPNGGKLKVNGYQSESGLFNRCTNKLFGVTFSIMYGPKLTDEALATGQVLSSGVNPYGANYKVTCGKLDFRDSSVAKRYRVSVELTGEETNHCIYRIHQR